MADTKMLQAIINGQKTIKEELKGDIDKIGKKILNVGKKVDENGRRIDTLGRQLAELDDDAPTREVFDGLTKEVKNIKQQVASN